MPELLVLLAQRMALIITIAYLFTRVPAFRSLLRRTASFKERLLFTALFTAVAIFGTCSAIEVQGALANTRVTGAVMAGLLGGPWMGGVVGLLSGLHRWSLGGFTGFACGLSTFTEGLFAGLIYLYYRGRRIGWQTALATGAAAETLQMIIILAVARPFDAALSLIQVIAVPMITINSLGIAIFTMIVNNAQDEEDRIAAVQAQKSLNIANGTLPYLRHGLNRESAARVAELIKNSTSVAAVAITDGRTILAHVGKGADHHLPGQKIMTEATRWALTHGKVRVAHSRQEINCAYPSCDLGSAVVVPLFSRNKVIGTLKLYRAKENGVSPADLEFARGLGHLFSTQLELAALEQESKLLKEAQFKALQAQVNPHFLFNSLNTILSLSRYDPETSRELLGHLGDFYRTTLLKNNRSFITLKEELERIDAYLAIEQARFGPRLQVFRDIDPAALSQSLPALILQPLVENCVKHGVLPKRGGGAVFIKAVQKDGSLSIAIEDNGVGIGAAPPVRNRLSEEEKGAGIGLANVDERLRTIYGPDHGLRIKSNPGRGTRFELAIPLPDADTRGSEGLEYLRSHCG